MFANRFVEVTLLLEAAAVAGQVTPNGARFQVNSFTRGLSVRARRFAASGDPLSEEFRVNSHTTGSQYSPAEASDAQGGFVIAWQGQGSSGTDVDGCSIQARRYTPAGTPLGGEFRVDSFSTHEQRLPAVASSPRGDHVVAWHGNGSSDTDSAADSSQAQRYDGLFRDGFESGDTGRWSAASP